MNKMMIAAMTMALVLAAGLCPAEAASNKKKPVKHDSRSNYTAEQREKIHLHALELCRKKYGRTSLRYATVDYTRHRVMCYIY